MSGIAKTYETTPLSGKDKLEEKQLNRNKVAYMLWLSGLLGLLLISITAGVMLGPVAISPEAVWGIIVSKVPVVGAWITAEWTPAHEHIVWDIRLPRVLLGAVVGAGLSIVGVAIQALVRNSLADPFILGVSSGASVGATLVILFGAFSVFGQYALSLAAFLGALVSIVLVFLLAQVNKRISTVRLLLAGIAISMILSAVTSFIVISAPREEGIRNALYWLMGSLAGGTWGNLSIPLASLGIVFLFLWLQSRSLNLLLMGEETAATLGMNIDQFRKILLVITALLTGVLVAVSGAIGFVGLMIPHIVRLLIGSDHKRVLPVSALLGAVFLIWADIGARLIAAPEEMPIGILTALCGGPFFIWLLRRSTYSFGSES
ncbi:FecCD family ABC transporter permease [Bacillus sp. FJAT-44742]|uniref:FecCD family ABC transporter permease n=1 Tax=Bacillus sp. FJAT-44742 TaxID=2014005 RepID=UPI003FA46122